MLEIDRVTRRFGDVVAVDEVSFTVPSGRMIGFVGSNGAGKTTTMRMIMGVLGTHGGHIRWRGQPITDLDRRSFGYMPEERGLYPKQKVIDQLIYLGRLRGMSKTDARAAAMGYLERFGLAERGKDLVEKLSLGNQQRVQVTAALLAQPECLILDEPFSGLDPSAVDAMAAVLAEHRARGVAILFSSHQLELIERLCDGLVVLAGGRVVLQGSAEALRAQATTTHRLVMAHDAAWVRGVPGVHVVDLDGGTAVVELDATDPQAAARALLMEGLAHGTVLEFGPIVPSLAQIYRKVTS